MKSNGWVVVIFENEHGDVDEVAYVKGPFELYEEAQLWAETNAESPGKVGVHGEWQITFIEGVDR